MKRITVLTPTYNRAYILDNLYNSLISQTVKDFIWLVIDDGSTDGTKDKIESYRQENKIEINYIFQKNCGKYVAHNTGVTMSVTELIVCVDSDDTLYPNAIEKTLRFWKEHRNDDIAGIVSPKDMGGTSYFNNPPSKSTLLNLYNKQQLIGETMLVFRTDVLKKYLFPEIKGEKFMSESVIYYQIDQEYSLVVQNEYLYKAEYQKDGLTVNITKVHWKNPKTTLIMYKAIAAFQSDFFTAAKAYGSYLAWKEIRKLDECSLFTMKINVKIVGGLLLSHYRHLFEKQKEELK